MDQNFSFFDHLDELRKRLLLSLIVVLVISLILFLFPQIIFDYVIFAPLKKSFITYKLLCKLKFLFGEAFCNIKDVRLQALTFEAQLSAHIMGAFTGGLILSVPFILYELWAFISPGLLPNERKMVLTIFWFAFPLFILGVMFSFFIMLPFVIQFLLNYTISTSVETIPTLSSYIHIAILFLLLSGLVFLLPLILSVLIYYGILSTEFLVKNRKYAIIITAIISAVITPTTDGITMMLMFLPIYFLYEISIWTGKILEKKKQKALSNVSS